jgi:hypothetical protein
MSGPWDAKYTEEQREASAAAYCDGMTANEVVQTAADGRLKYRGEPLEPFEIKASTVASYAHKLRRRRAGRADTKLADMAPRDAVETLRRRLLNIAHEELAHEEKKKRGNRDPARIREWTRCVLEASRLPGPTDARPASEHTRGANGQKGPRSTGGPAGALLKDHRQGGPAQDEAQNNRDGGDNGATHHTPHRSNEQQRDEPGSLPSSDGQQREALPVVV